MGNHLITSVAHKTTQNNINQFRVSSGSEPFIYNALIALQCERTTALQAVHTELHQPPTKIGIIGSGCSVATEPTAEVSRHYNLTHVSGLL